MDWFHMYLCVNNRYPNLKKQEYLVNLVYIQLFKKRLNLIFVFLFNFLVLAQFFCHFVFRLNWLKILVIISQYYHKILIWFFQLSHHNLRKFFFGLNNTILRLQNHLRKIQIYCLGTSLVSLFNDNFSSLLFSISFKVLLLLSFCGIPKI